MEAENQKAGNTAAKKAAADKAVLLIGDGMIVGLGSGSTSELAIRKLGERVKDGLKIQAVATSIKSETVAKECGIRVIDPSDAKVIDIAIDGADQADKNGNLVKGGGGSLLREKIIAYASRRFHVMIDESKLVEHLGSFPLPIEVVPFAIELTLKQIRDLGCRPALRRKGENLFVSDNGNYVCDCKFDAITDPAWLDVKLKMIPGVVETGLFSSQVVTSLVIGYHNGDAIEVAVSQ